MTEAAHPSPIDRARDAMDRGEWRRSYELLTRADAESQLDEPALQLLAATAYAVGDVDVTIDAWERVHGAAATRGDAMAAAEAATSVALHLLIDTGLLAPVRGWTQRANRLLAPYVDTPVHAMLAVVQSYERLLSGDFDAALTAARTATRIGIRNHAAAAALGRIAEARALILTGQVQTGLALLNEAAVAAVSGEIDPLSTGMVYCEVICAMQALGQFDAAEQWTQAMERWRQDLPVGSVHGRCRLHRAEILRLRGACSDAEREALAACAELRPYLRREFGWPLCELGRIRLRTGDLQGAEDAFLAAHRAGWDPEPGLALIQLSRGDVAAAVAAIREALARPINAPSKELPPNSDLRRAPLLEAAVEIALAAGHLDEAGTAADELARIAADFESAAWRAAANTARGRVQTAAGQLSAAGASFDRAIAEWGDIGAPYEQALARLGLARALALDGRGTQAEREANAARAALAAIGAVVNPTIGPADSSSPPAAPVTRVSGSPPTTRPFRRDGDDWVVAFEGATLRLRDAVGLRYIARLLAEPGREFHALDLVAGERGQDPEEQRLRRAVAASDLGPLLDRRAKAAHRRRLEEIDRDLEEAARLGDSFRAAQSRAERDFLTRELARAVGRGGRDRPLGSAAERARASVTRAIRLAVGRIRRHHAGLADHLDAAIRTGAYCAYQPDPQAQLIWVTSPLPPDVRLRS